MQAITIQDFFTRYKDLKAKEKWKKIIKLGNKALKNDCNHIDSLTIHNILTTTSFYLSDIDGALNYGNAALKISESHTDVSANESVRALYLLSAVYRAKNDKDTANEYIQKALIAIKDKNISDHIRAKVFFNAGALQQDLYEKPQSALEFFDAAIRLFPQNHDDYIRTMIRIIKCIFTQNAKYLPLAESKLSEIESFIIPETKTHVHFLQLKAKICIKSDNIEEAKESLNLGIKIAANKDMKQDYDRLNSLLYDIMILEYEKGYHRYTLPRTSVLMK